MIFVSSSALLEKTSLKLFWSRNRGELPWIQSCWWAKYPSLRSLHTLRFALCCFFGAPHVGVKKMDLKWLEHVLQATRCHSHPKRSNPFGTKLFVSVFPFGNTLVQHLVSTTVTNRARLLKSFFEAKPESGEQYGCPSGKDEESWRYPEPAPPKGCFMEVLC